MSSSICCAAHNCTTTSPAIQNLTKMYSHGAQLVTGGQPVSWGGKIESFSSFAPTQALDALAAQRPIPVKKADGTSVAPTVLKVSTLKLCKQHSAGDCKLGAMCRNIHLCPEVLPSSSKQPKRAESANRQGLKLPPIPGALQQQGSVVVTSTMIRGTSPVALPTIPTTGAGIVPAPERSCNSPVKSARSARLAGVDASKMKPVPPPPRGPSATQNSTADLDDIVLVSTPVPTPPPRAPSAGVSTGSGCFRRFVKRWNEPLKAGSSSGVVASLDNSRVVSSAGNSIDLEVVRCNVQTLEIAAAENDQEVAADDVQPLPPTNASGEGRCYARKSAFENHEGFFAVFA